ncbi:MAG: 6,7-dimethyl-8-ribityllumazine synthase [Acidobacteriota bacterium]
MKTDLTRPQLSAADLRFAIVVSRWNDALTSRLADGSVEGLTSLGADPNDIEIFQVPGAFELPLVCLTAARSGRFDAVIALGIVIRGDTPHFEYVAGQAAAGCTQAALESGIPVLFGVITADNMDQAVARSREKADNKGYEAALSAVEMATLMQGMKALDRRDVQQISEDFSNVA